MTCGVESSIKTCIMHQSEEKKILLKGLMGHILMGRCWDSLPGAREGGLAHGQPLIRPRRPKAAVNHARRPG